MVTTTFAEMTLSKYKEKRNSQNEVEKSVIKIYVGGVGEGFGWANSELQSRKDKPLFCQPQKLALTNENYIRILDDELEIWEKNITDESERKKFFDKVTIEPLLLQGLKRTFPCN